MFKEIFALWLSCGLKGRKPRENFFLLKNFLNLFLFTTLWIKNIFSEKFLTGFLHSQICKQHRKSALRKFPIVALYSNSCKYFLSFSIAHTFYFKCTLAPVASYLVIARPDFVTSCNFFSYNFLRVECSLIASKRIIAIVTIFFLFLGFARDNFQM